MRLALLVTQLIFSTFLAAQMNSWMPVKVNHKLGFINPSGEVIVEPKYDAVGDKPLEWNRFFTGLSDFILVENQGKLGLIDRTGQEILEPNYLQIRPINDTLFVVTLDSLFTIVNRSGKVLIDSRYEDIRPIYNSSEQVKDYFMVKKDLLWGVHKREGHQVFAPQFGYIEILQKGLGYFKVKKEYGDKHWGLFGSDAKQLLPYAFTKIDVINDDFIIALDKDRAGRYSVWNHEGSQVLPAEYFTYRQLNQHLISLKKEDRKWYLYSFKNQKFLPNPKEYDQFLPLDSNYVIAKKGKLMGILDNLGNEVLAPTFTAIEPARPPFYKVRKRNWGLFTFKDNLVVDCKYQAIADFNGMNALVRKDDLYGMINIKGEEVIPTKFEKVQKEDNYYKGFFDISMTLYEMNDSGQVLNEEYFPEVYTLSIGYETDMFGDAVTMDDIRSFQNGNRGPNILGGLGSQSFWSPTDTLFIENSPWKWQNNDFYKKYELINTAQNKVIKKPLYTAIRNIPEARLTMVFTAGEPVLNRISSIATFPIDTACAMALFSHDEGKFITGFDMMGLNRQDFQKGQSYARFIDLKGKYGLINNNGEQAKDEFGNPFRFTFIGDFQNGKARACLGGRISIVDLPKYNKYATGFTREFVTEYYITPTRFFSMPQVAKFHIAPVGEKGANWGYIDMEGNFIMDPVYDYASDFEDSSAVNQKEGLWGIINENEDIILDFKFSSIVAFDGNWKISLPNQKPIFFNSKGHELIGLKYSKFGGFSEGMCAVRIDSLWGFVNESGDEVIPCQYKEVKKFSEDWAAVRYDDYWFYINKSGEKVLNLDDHIQFVESVGSFNNGLCWIKTGKWYGFINKKGKLIIEAAFTKAFDFHDGVARVVFNKKTGLIDTHGDWILKPKDYEVIFPFDQNGIAVIRSHFKKPSGLINKKGEILTELKYRIIEPEKNGFYKVSDGDLWGFINTKGEEVIPVIYDQVTDIENDIVAVSLPSQLTWFYINTKNERAFKGNYEIAESFHQGYAYVQKHEYDDETKMHINIDGEYFNPTEQDLVMHFSQDVFGMFTQFGTIRRFRNQLNYYYCDKDGVNILNRNFEGIEPFKNNTAPVKIDGKWGLINKTGVFMIEPKYAKINQLKNDLVHVRPNILFGMADKKGKILIEPKYDRLDKQWNIYRLERGEAIGYIDQNFEWLWEIQN